MERGREAIPIQAADVANYVGAMTYELHEVATTARLPFLAYLLQMAHEVAIEEKLPDPACQPEADEP